jgi:hypothetical protein
MLAAKVSDKRRIFEWHSTADSPVQISNWPKKLGQIPIFICGPSEGLVQARGEPKNLGRQKIQDGGKIEIDSTFSTYFQLSVDSHGSNEEQYSLRPAMEAKIFESGIKKKNSQI